MEENVQGQTTPAPQQQEPAMPVNEGGQAPVQPTAASEPAPAVSENSNGSKRVMMIVAAVVVIALVVVALIAYF